MQQEQIQQPKQTKEEKSLLAYLQKVLEQCKIDVANMQFDEKSRLEYLGKIQKDAVIWVIEKQWERLQRKVLDIEDHSIVFNITTLGQNFKAQVVDKLNEFCKEQNIKFEKIKRNEIAARNKKKDEGKSNQNKIEDLQEEEQSKSVQFDNEYSGRITVKSIFESVLERCDKSHAIYDQVLYCMLASGRRIEEILSTTNFTYKNENYVICDKLSKSNLENQDIFIIGGSEKFIPKIEKIRKNNVSQKNLQYYITKNAQFEYPELIHTSHDCRKHYANMFCFLHKLQGANKIKAIQLALCHTKIQSSQFYNSYAFVDDNSPCQDCLANNNAAPQIIVVEEEKKQEIVQEIPVSSDPETIFCKCGKVQKTSQKGPCKDIFKTFYVCECLYQLRKKIEQEKLVFPEYIQSEKKLDTANRVLAFCQKVQELSGITVKQQFEMNIASYCFLCYGVSKGATLISSGDKVKCSKDGYLPSCMFQLLPQFIF